VGLELREVRTRGEPFGASREGMGSPLGLGGSTVEDEEMEPRKVTGQGDLYRGG
jgi:hypothetical protein